MTDWIIADKVLETPDGWRVRFNGAIQRPVFQSHGAAQAFLDGLQSGYRKPEPELQQ